MRLAAVSPGRVALLSRSTVDSIFRSPPIRRSVGPMGNTGYRNTRGMARTGQFVRAAATTGSFVCEPQTTVRRRVFGGYVHPGSAGGAAAQLADLQGWEDRGLDLGERLHEALEDVGLGPPPEPDVGPAAARGLDLAEDDES